MSLKDYHFTPDSFKAKYFGEGVYKVNITAVEAGTTQSGSDYFQFSFVGANGEAETWARMWLTPKAYEYTARNIRGIAVHNCESDEKKDEMRKYFDTNVKNGEDLYAVAQAIAQQKAECWIERSRQDEPYSYRDDGTPKHGYNVNFRAYDPTKAKTEEYVVSSTTTQPAAPSEAMEAKSVNDHDFGVANADKLTDDELKSVPF